MKVLSAIAVLASALGAQTLGEPYFLMRFTQGEPSAIQPYQDFNANIDVVGMQAITGETQTWLIEPHSSFASIEALDQAMSAARAVQARRMIGVYRIALSYRPDEAIKLMRSARYFQISIFRTRPGADVDFAELIRLRKAAFDNMNVDRPELGYQILSGAGLGTYIFLAPLPSLRTLDNSFARMSNSPDGPSQSPRRQESRQIQWEADITRELMLCRVQPGISHVTEAFSAADPEFWRRR
ncbi:MAG TPA: hypothetical protein VER03_20225 [Bryobacteraceae bacterium]|nr:hypothetical protein [Bryobacteraceae bacterium]